MRRALALGGLGLALAMVDCHAPHRKEHAAAERKAEAPTAETELTVEPRTQLLLTYPCSQKCHSKRESNGQKRELKEFHTVRNTEFHHGDPAGWCYQCHSQENIDRLHGGKGELVTFDQAYLLCGGCHGDKLRDWRLQVHGKTLGNWSGPKVRRSCTACHNPHNPRFTRLKPEPPDVPPTEAKRH